MGKNVIFYFTGTGNSLKAAKDIANKLTDCELFLMPAYKEKHLLAEYERVGFVFPVYAGGPPLCVQKFMNEMDFSQSKDSYFFAVLTYGGSQGNSFHFLKEVFNQKGMLLHAGFGVNMKPNYIVSYPISRKNVEKIHRRSHQKIRGIAEQIKQKENTPIPSGKNPLFAFMNKKFTSRYYGMDQDYHVSDRCVGCGICSKVCPVENIVMKNGRPTFEHHCEQCVACIHSCPKQAINYKNKTVNRARYINPDVSVNELGIPRNSLEQMHK